jgi:hypothetical protein
MMKRLLVIAVAALALASCGSQSPQSAMRSWMSSSSFLENAHQLHIDALHSETALRTPAMNALDLHTVCGVLLFETQAVNASLPTPDAQLTSILANAFNTLGDGANECYRAGSSPQRRHAAIGYLQRGISYLFEGAARADVVQG